MPRGDGEMSMRIRFVVLTAVTLVVLLGWFALVYRPARSELAEVKTKVQAAQTEVAELEARLARLQVLKRNEKELRAQAVKFDKALPADPAISPYIRQVENIAKEAGIDFISITPSLPGAPTAGAAAPAAPVSPPPGSPAPASPGPSSPSPAATTGAPSAAPAQGPAAAPLRSISVSISAGGSFFAIENFISKMENLERAIRIDDFALSGAAEPGAAAPAISVSMKLQMFMGGPAAPAPTPGADPAGDPDAVDRFTGGATQGVE